MSVKILVELHRPRDDPPSRALSSLLDNPQAALSCLKSSKASEKRASRLVCMTLALSAAVSCSWWAMRCSLVRSEQSWGRSLGAIV